MSENRTEGQHVDCADGVNRADCSERAEATSAQLAFAQQTSIRTPQWRAADSARTDRATAAPAAATSTPAFDTTIWRVVGSPLAAPTGHGALDGLGVAVKDLFAVKGFAVGAGNPQYLADAAPQPESAPAVRRLLDAGAHVVGIAQTDEFAYSLAGANVHYGTPPNPQAPGRISGGSSSGPAAAVATGQADIGLGTDTAGSLRIPGSYEGLWAIRTTHNRVPRTGVHPLSDSFDTVGVLARDGAVFTRAVDALMPEPDSISAFDVLADGGLAVAPALDADVQPDVAEVLEAFRDAVRRYTGGGRDANGGASDDASDVASSPMGGARQECGHTINESPASPRIAISKISNMDVDESDLDEWESIFQVVRGYEAWRGNGAWVRRHMDSLAPEIAARFERDSHIVERDYIAGLERLETARAELRESLGNRVLLIPAASSVAPPADAAPEARAQIAKARADTIRLTSLAGVGGLPAVTIPLLTHDGLPCGVCLVGPAGCDRTLSRAAVELLRELVR